MGLKRQISSAGRVWLCIIIISVTYLVGSTAAKEALDRRYMPPIASAVTLNGYGYAPEALRYFWFGNVDSPKHPLPVHQSPTQSTMRSRSRALDILPSSQIKLEQDQISFQSVAVNPGQVTIPIPINYGKSLSNYYYGPEGGVGDPWYPFMTTSLSTKNPYHDIHGTNAGYIANYPYYHGMYNHIPNHHYLDKYHYELEPVGQQHTWEQLLLKHQQQQQHILEHPEHFHRSV